MNPFLVFKFSEVAFFLKLFMCARCSPQAPNSSESPGTSRTEHSDLLEEEEDERSDIKVRKKNKKLKYHGRSRGSLMSLLKIRLLFGSSESKLPIGWYKTRLPIGFNET